MAPNSVNQKNKDINEKSHNETEVATDAFLHIV